MPIQKRTVSGVGKPAEPKQSSAEPSPLKATPFAAHAAKKKAKKLGGFTATTLQRGKGPLNMKTLTGGHGLS